MEDKEMIYQEEIEKVYKETQEFGRIDFVKLIVDLKEENEHLKKSQEEAIKYIKDTTIAFSNFTKLQCGLNSTQVKELLSILEKEK